MSDENETRRLMSPDEMDYLLETTGINALEGMIKQGNNAEFSVDTDDSTQENSHGSIRHSSPSILSVSKIIEEDHGRTQLFCLYGLLMIICIAESISMTATIPLVMDKVAQGIAEEDGHYDRVAVQTIVSGISSSTMMIAGAISIFMAGKWGELSDRIGRVRVFKYMSGIRVFGLLSHAFTLSSKMRYHKWAIILTACIVPSFGGLFALVANGNSYVSDIVKTEHRMVTIGIMMSCIYATMGAGPMLGSFLVKWTHGNGFIPIYTAIIFVILAFIICETIMVEPRHETQLAHSQSSYTKRRDKLRSQSGSGNTRNYQSVTYGKFQIMKLLDLLAPVKKLWLKPDTTGSLLPRHTVILLVVLDILFVCGTTSCMPALVLFSTYEYKWHAVELGYFISILGIGRGVVLLIVSPALLYVLKRFYQHLNHSIDKIDIFCIRFSMIVISLSLFVMLRFGEKSSTSMVVFALLQALSAFCSPTLQSGIIKYTSKKHTGEMFGAMALVRSCVMLVIPPVLLKLYGSTVSANPSLFIYIPFSASIVAILLTFFLRIYKNPPLDIP
ncbi:YJL163C [Saccharomyces arboricola H-6]|uniref:YJL163C n=1 Tax=Saccharomyces arboricola (strain H-6 / AS 2.3317 / CBS 10644) TaxID=1160507 RepID=J8Q6K4_SACAR|nr:YJL163C [Saccharomyces arboricola H-6]